MKVIIAAAGSAGHINPGLAIANKIKKEESDSEIVFIGTNRGIENDLVPRAGYELKAIDAYGLSSKITIENMKKMYKTIKGISQAKKIIKEFKPDIVIGAGGYICGAVVIAAKKYKVPVVLHESNANPGKATKFLSKKADEVLISFEAARKKLPKANKVVYTGTPVKINKREYQINEKLEIIKQIGLKETKPIILIFGGSQGAQKINEAVVEILKNKLNSEYQILWATGPKQYDIIKKILEENKIDIEHIENAKALPYIYNMEEAMNIANVIVSRSGAMTITEIANLGKPSILIPLPNVSGEHQLHNAEVMEKSGASQIILNNELDGNKLNNKIIEIIKNKLTEEKMGENALKNAVYHAENKIYEEIKKCIKKTYN